MTQGCSFLTRLFSYRHCEPPEEARQSSFLDRGISGLLRDARNDEYLA